MHIEEIEVLGNYNSIVMPENQILPEKYFDFLAERL
jgi:hypothetical protein